MKFIAKFCPKFNCDGPKNIYGGHNFFLKVKKIINFLKFRVVLWPP